MENTKNGQNVKQIWRISHTNFDYKYLTFLGSYKNISQILIPTLTYLF